MSAPTLGLAIIARDEADTLPNLLASVEGAFDQVALLDTGSTDRTVEVFEEWSAAENERRPGFVSTLGHFQWCDDFAAARTAADELLETDWLCWADCDDWLEGALEIKPLLQEAPPGVEAVLFPYFVTDRPPRNAVRLIHRTADAPWQSRVHEVRDLSRCAAFPPFRWDRSPVRWRTDRCPDRAASLPRNLAIARRWAAEEPEDPSARRMLAMLELRHGDIAAALPLIRDLAEHREARWAVATIERLHDAGLEGFDPDLRQMFVRPLIALLTGNADAAMTAAYALQAPVWPLDREPERAAEAIRADLRRALRAVDPCAPVDPPTRQQRRAEARRRAKEMARG